MRAEGKVKQLEYSLPEDRRVTSEPRSQSVRHGSRTIHHASAGSFVPTGTKVTGPASRKVTEGAASANYQSILTRVRALQARGGPFSDIEVDGLINELRLPTYYFYDEQNLPDDDVRLLFSLIVELQGLCDGISDKRRGSLHYNYLEQKFCVLVGRLSDNNYRRQPLAIEFAQDILQKGVRNREFERKILSSLEAAVGSVTFSALLRIAGTEDSLSELCFLRNVASLINQYQLRLPSLSCYKLYHALAVRCCIQGEYDEAREHIEQACRFEKQNRLPHFLEVIDVLSGADCTRDVSGQIDETMKELEVREKKALCLNASEISNPQLKEEQEEKFQHMSSDDLYKLTELVCSTAEHLLLCRAQGMKTSFREKLNFSTLTPEQMPLQMRAFSFLKASCQGAFGLARCSDSFEVLSLYHRIRGVIDAFPIADSRKHLHEHLFSAYVNILYWLPEEVFSVASGLEMFPDGIEVEKSLIASNTLRHNGKYPEALVELEKVKNKAVEYHCHKAVIQYELTGSFSEEYSELEKARTLLGESRRKRDVYLYNKRMAFMLSKAARMPELPEELSSRNRDEILKKALEYAVIARDTMQPRISLKLNDLIKALQISTTSAS